MFEKQIITTPSGARDRIELLHQLGDEVKYNSTRYVAKAEELQKLLNLTGAHIREDGKAGSFTSDAYKKLTGKYINGDPRAEE